MGAVSFARTTTPILTSAARTTSGTSGAFSVGNLDSIVVLVNVTAASGTTPTLDVKVEWSDDGTTWYAADPADGFTQITAAGSKAKRFDVKGLKARLNYTIAGTTPSFTFDADAITGS